MNKFLKAYFSGIVFILLFGCPSEDECTKIIVVRPEFSITSPYGTTSYPEQTQEIPCDWPEPTPAEPISEGNVLNNFSYEVINFKFTPDTGNNTSRLEFEIKLNNENDFIVRGEPILTIDSDNIQFSRSYSADASSPCNEIGAYSSCILTCDKEYPHEPNLGPPPTKFELAEVKYVL